jgi:tRNA(Ile)-lysidine synthase
MGLHPSVAAVRVGVRRTLAGLEAAPRVVVACSGGADSLALLAATVFEGRKVAAHVIGATVDHGLRDDSAEVAARVVGQMAALGTDETVSARVEVDAAGLGPEAAAREARYAVLGQVAERFGAAAVLLGHTRDDQAETVLLGLAHGSGGRSLAGMRRAYGVFHRPLLDVGRADTETACQVQGIEWWRDPHNDDPGYARVRVRQRVLPVLEAELGPGVAATLARTADQVRADVELLDDLADREYAGLTDPADAAGVTLPVAGLAALPPAIRTRVLHRAALAAGSPARELTHDHVRAIEELVTSWRGQRWIDLPGPVRAHRAGDIVRLDIAPDGG